MTYDQTYSKTQQISQAVRKLVPGATYNVRKQKVEWTDKVKTEPTQSQIDAQIATNKAEWENKEYQRKRGPEYPSYADQFDLIYHSGVDAWKAKIKETKDKYPKS